MAIRTLTEPEARQVAMDYLRTRSRGDTYKLFNPNHAKLKRHTVHCNTHDLFAQPLVKHSITDIQSHVLEKTMKNLGIDLERQLNKLNDIMDSAIAAKQYHTAATCVKEQSKLLKLYEETTSDAPPGTTNVPRAPKQQLTAVQ